MSSFKQTLAIHRNLKLNLICVTSPNQLTAEAWEKAVQSNKHLWERGSCLDQITLI